MSPRAKAPGDIVGKLSDILRREEEAISRRDLGKILALSAKKLALADRLASRLADVSAADDARLKARLQELSGVARSNAVLLEHLRAGVARARARLQSVSADARLPGVYQAAGRPLKPRSAGSAGRSA